MMKPKINITRLKNKLLILSLVLGNLPRTFFNLDKRINLSIFIERSTRIDFFYMYYVTSINFMILAYCLYKNKGVDKRISKFILILTVLDFLHLLLFASKGFGMAKIGIALFIYFLSNKIKNDKTKIAS